MVFVFWCLKFGVWFLMFVLVFVFGVCFLRETTKTPKQQKHKKQSKPSKFKNPQKAIKTFKTPKPSKTIKTFQNLQNPQNTTVQNFQNPKNPRNWCLALRAKNSRNEVAARPRRPTPTGGAGKTSQTLRLPKQSTRGRTPREECASGMFGK